MPESQGIKNQIHQAFNFINFKLLGIILIAALLRIVFLARKPLVFSRDELSYGYDAYSILETLRDQYGEFLPFFVKAFDDYRESLYIFITAPFIKVFGLNEFAVRLPAALIGTLTVLALYCLVKECFDEKKALVAALLLAINPWHIHFSRIGYRAILVPCLFCLGVFFLVRSLKRSKSLIPAAFILGLSLYTYPTARVFVPLFILTILVLFKQHFWSIKKQTLVAGSIFLLILLPLFNFWITPEGMARAKKIEDNSFLEIGSNYLSYYSPNFLLQDSRDPERRDSPYKIHFFELITICAGIFAVLKSDKKVRNVLLAWLLLYPIPAAFIEANHEIRPLVGAPLFSTLSACGIWSLADLIKSEFSRKIYFFITTVLVVVSITIFCNYYFSRYQETKVWQYGLKEAILYAEKSSYEQVVISDKFRRAYIFILFYTQYSPSLYQLSPIDPSIKTGYSIGKYYVDDISQKQASKEQFLFIIMPEQINEILAKGYHWREVKVIKDPQGVELVKLIEATS